MHFSWVLLFCFFSFGFSIARSGDKGTSDELRGKWRDAALNEKEFKATEARLAALRAAANAAVARQEAKAYSILKETATSEGHKARAASLALKSRKRAEELAEESRLHMRQALSSTVLGPRSFAAALGNRNTGAGSAFQRGILRKKEKESALVKAAHRAAAAASFLRSLSAPRVPTMVEADLRSDHDYSYDNVDDYVNDYDSNSTELYYSIFDYDTGIKNKNMFEISPKDLLPSSHSNGTEVTSY